MEVQFSLSVHYKLLTGSSNNNENKNRQQHRQDPPPDVNNNNPTSATARNDTKSWPGKGAVLQCFIGGKSAPFVVINAPCPYAPLPLRLVCRLNKHLRRNLNLDSNGSARVNDRRRSSQTRVSNVPRDESLQLSQLLFHN